MVIDKSSSDVEDAVDNKTKIMKEVRNINKTVYCLLSWNFLRLFEQGLCPAHDQLITEIVYKWI